VIGSDDDRVSTHFLGYIMECVPVCGVRGTIFDSKRYYRCEYKRNSEISIQTCLFYIRVDPELHTI